MTFQQSPHLVSLPDRPQHLATILAWNLQVWGDRIPGYDQEGWEAFYRRALLSDYARYQLGAELVWAIELEGKCVGSIALVGEDDLPSFVELSPWMAAFVIDPALRHQGLGRRVVSLFEQWCREHGIERLFLWTDTYAHWYSSLGYQEIATTRLAEINAVVMAKDLRALP